MLLQVKGSEAHKGMDLYKFLSKKNFSISKSAHSVSMQRQTIAIEAS